MRRIGFNIRIADGIDGAYYLDVMRALKPTFGLHLAAPQQSVMNDWGLVRALEVIEATEGQTKIIVRFPDSGDGEKFHWRQGETFITNSLNAWATLPGATHPNIYFNVLNEPPTHVGEDVNRICDWLALFMRRASERGIKLCVFNSGVDQSLHLEEGRYDDLLHTLALYRGQHLLGVHEYAGPSMPNSMSHPPEYMRDAEYIDKLQPDNWPSPAEVQVARTADGSYPPYWLMFRGVWLAIRSRELGLGDPDIVVTETGWDRLQNLEDAGVYAALEGRYGWPRETWGQMRGINTLERVWESWWPQWTPDEAAFEQYRWRVRCAPACYKAFLHFAWWPSSEWSDMDIAGRRDLHKLLIEAANAEETPPPGPLPVNGEGEEETPPAPIPLPEPEPEPEPEPIPNGGEVVKRPNYVPLLLGAAVFALLLLTLGVLLAALPPRGVSAQAVEGETSPPAPLQNGEGSKSMSELIAYLVEWLGSTTHLLWAVPTVLLLAGPAKWLIPANVLSGKTIALAIQVIIWVVWAIAQYYGKGDLVQAVLENMTPLAAAVFNLVFGSVATQAVYERVKAQGIVYQRPDKPKAAQFSASKSNGPS